MCPVIRVSSELYLRLEKHARGFDTPSQVIERVLDAYEGRDRSAEHPGSAESPSGVRDRTKYAFEGQLLGKGRLVLAVIKTFVARHPAATREQLLDAFPKQLQGPMGVFASKDEAEEISRRTSHSRHYIKPDELVALADGDVAVSSQWGAGNIDNFVAAARALGFEITEQAS